MGVSYDLISEFVKITNDKKDDKKEGTVYATVVGGTEDKYVRIDGSDLLTPMDTTTDIEDGERVTLMIKDHKAIVTGNVTTPSASTTKVHKVAESVNSVSDRVGTFELVVADKVSTNELEAYKATIEVLIANKATIEDLTATNAIIENLKVKDAEIEHAVVENLKATTADINILNADFAQIKTLVNGNLTSDNILSFNLTSEKVTVDDAFIKDAMIDTISAGKINAGKINTNSVSIGSEDGGMLITGSTQQFTDKNGNVRIQIGKDASGDFTFVLYSEDGTGQIINQNGITASAIGDGLIVNNMVSDNAAIAGGKLDISSVITEINGDTSTTIKSSKIYLNEQQQSLEVAFNSLKTKVDTIQEITVEGDLTAIIDQVQSNTTKIEANTESISTLISEDTIIKKQVTDLEGTLNETETTLTSQYTSLNQSLEGFKTTVADTYATKSSVTDVVDNLSANYSTTSTMNSAIEQKTQEISASVSSTYATKNEVNTLDNNLRTNYSTTQQMESAINVAKDAVTTTVSNLRTEVMNASYNNLLWNSDFLTRENDFPKGYHSLNRTYCFGSGWTCPNGGSTITIDTSGGGVSWQGFTSSAIRVQQYQTLTASVYVAIDNEAYRGSVNFGLEIEWLGADGNRISASGGAFVMESVFNWERHSATGTAPEGTVYARIYCWNEHQGASWWGEPMLQFGSVMTAWTRGGDLEGIDQRISYAEQKITDDAITNTVKQNFYTKNETENAITSKGYATTSQVQQTANDVTFKFTQSGGYNFIRNGNAKNGQAHWNAYYLPEAGWGVRNDEWTGYEPAFQINAPNATTMTNAIYQIVDGLITGETYTFSALVAGHRGSNIIIIVNGEGTTEIGCSDAATDYYGGPYYDNWKKISGTFKATGGSCQFRLCHYDGWGNSFGWFKQIQINRGTVPLPYSPHPSELYDGITTIDKDGIKVETNVGARTQFSAKGMDSYDNEGNQTLGIRNGGLTFYAANNHEYVGYISQSVGDTQDRNGVVIGLTRNGDYLALGTSEDIDPNQGFYRPSWILLSRYEDQGEDVNYGINMYRDLYMHDRSLRNSRIKYDGFKRNKTDYIDFYTSNTTSSSQLNLELADDSMTYFNIQANNYNDGGKYIARFNYQKGGEASNVGIHFYRALNCHGYNITNVGNMSVYGLSAEDLVVNDVRVAAPYALCGLDGEEQPSLSVVKSVSDVTEVNGIATVVNGKAEVKLPDGLAFSDYYVQVTPNKVAAVAITERRDSSFVIETNSTEEIEVFYTIKALQPQFINRKTVDGELQGEDGTCATREEL